MTGCYFTAKPTKCPDKGGLFGRLKSEFPHKLGAIFRSVKLHELICLADLSSLFGHFMLTLPVFKSRFNIARIVCSAVTAIISLTLLNEPSTYCHGQSPQSSRATANLQASVAKLNHWLRDSPHSPGWRRYLHLNQLDAESSIGENADVFTLQKILRQFSSGASGLDAPEFNNVRLALIGQIALLSTDRKTNLVTATQQAMGKYRQISIADLDYARNQTVYELESLKQCYRATMPSRARAELFYALQLDEQIAHLKSLEFELPPEVSAGKVRSMIRDEQKKLKEIDAKIDAMPVPEDSDDDEDDENEPPRENENDDPSARSEAPFLNPPGPDNGKETLADLESRSSVLKDRVSDLQKMLRDLVSEDSQRVDLRRATLRQLANFNKRFSKKLEDHFDPWLASVAMKAEYFYYLYFYGTDDNLQEEFLKRVSELSELVQASPDLSDRLAHGKTGILLQWLESSGQVPELVAAIRNQHSLPNFHASVSANLINRLIPNDVNECRPVKENFFGRIVRGTANIMGDVNVRLIPDPHQVNLALELNGNVNSRTYSRERRWRIDAFASGTFCATRKILASVRGLSWTGVISDAKVYARFGGISSQLKVVKRKALETFLQQKPRNDAESSRRIKKQITDGFVERTDMALQQGQSGLAMLEDRIDEFARFLPSFFLRTLHDRVELVARKTERGSLAAPTAPIHYAAYDDIAVDVHETLLTNYIDPVLAGKTFSNIELQAELKNRFGVELPKQAAADEAEPDVGPRLDNEDEVEEDDEVEQEKEFSISFARARPVQLEFKDNQIAIVVTGRRFSQGRRSIRAGLSFRLTFRIERRGGELKLFRVGKTEIEFANPESTDARLLAFRSFLEKRLNQSTKADEGVALPPNLIPQALINARPAAADLILNTLRIERGWISLGWNQAAASPAGARVVWEPPPQRPRDYDRRVTIAGLPRTLSYRADLRLNQ